MADAGPLIEVRNLKKNFPGAANAWGKSSGVVQAVSDVSFDIGRGETLALVGESGCGKSTLGRLMLRLIESTSGTVSFDGRDLTAMTGETLRRARPSFQLIFQDSGSAFNPRMRISDIVEEPLRIMGRPAAERKDRVLSLLQSVGIDRNMVDRFPHEFSGGQRQRIGIARALVSDPKFIVCDEPVSALDVSIQGQVVNLLMDLQRDFGLTYLFVSHDLRVVRHVSDRVAVMYLGGIVELGPVGELYDHPRHPYTRALLAAMPRKRREAQAEPAFVGGEIPSARNPPSGCRFHTRCPIAQQVCSQQRPVLEPAGAEHQVACHFPG
ncbi:oligopeptide/dipeptide ABC transporter ATP-binding protein [Bradyrhizobium sp. dw_411]|uniref:ABC transporter ATP-binding protein n=1 Tax=Bradyrhizobium sp. dw_411 TaxID=2720082 RepID=UPI001BD0AA91|nr:oligopeptide/dipeptide ABC transporter ATP-binding protein [Bradyrhizobium sp. dw_411]